MVNGTNTKRPEVVFLDVGDTLIRAHPSWAGVYRRGLLEAGIDVPEKDLEHALLIFRDAAFAAELPRWPVARCEILTYTEDDLRSAEDTDDVDD